ncbi:hypothetical protein BB559_000564 [Furculomyces boomerangus]|uniref:ATP synthase subunit d, mitochondrial n=2 Tax=Harpellales TaxID=61421 RepID=A0A2T9Z4Y8_9FUNG|nr:hypothetical protein BB559_000564 [Furculomyces boomerangus]PWA00932.1 hypothetical protein BB558_002982 [Smittium angustum]
MSVNARKLVQAIDWPRVSAVLARKPEVVKSLSAFNKKFQEVDRELVLLKEQKLDLDFDHYRKVLKNKKIVDDMELKFKSYEIKKLDTKEHLKIIGEFESSATASATGYASELETKLSGLFETVGNIENARPVNQVTTDDIVTARPETIAEVEDMVRKGEYTVPGYDTKFPDLSVV